MLVLGLVALAQCSGSSTAHTVNGGYRVRDNRDAPSRGPADARIVIQLFSEFECTYCARVEPTLNAILERYPNDVRIVWRDYPLESHPHAMLAAEAAREAHVQQGADGFWRYHDTLFAHQNALERADLERFAADAGLDLARFRAALDRHVHLRAIRSDIAAANGSGVRIGTPSLFVNGQLLVGALSFAEFAQVIDRQLGNAN